VQAGDTLYGIAKARVTSITLMARHGIAQDNLTPGNVIQIPVGNPAYCPGRRPYAVGEGDTAFGIARKFGTTAENIRSINGLDANYTIYAASIICVP
jgi:LysM repeat protein